MRLTQFGVVCTMMSFLGSYTSTGSGASAQQTQEVNKTITIDSSEPYMVMLSFTRASHDYTKHSYYGVRIKGKTHCPSGIGCVYLQVAKYASNGTIIHDLRIEKVENGSKREVTASFGPVIPGSYKIEVIPYGEGTSCFVRPCADVRLDSDVFHSDAFTITGSDYLPPTQLVLTLSHQTDELSLQIPIAPSSYFITDYIVTIRGNNTDSQNITETYHEAARSHWSVANKYIAGVANFRPGEALRAEIVPIILENLCNEDGMYNYNGTCYPFTPALSNKIIFERGRHPVTVRPDANSSRAIYIEITVGSLVGVLLLLCIIIGGVLVVRYRRSQRRSNVEDEESQESLNDNELNEGEDVTIGSSHSLDDLYIGQNNNKSICIVYIDVNPRYRILTNTLKNVFESKYFGISEVVIYRGEGEVPYFAGFTCVLVLDSDDLFQACKDLLYDDSISAASIFLTDKQKSQRKYPRSKSCVAHAINILKSEHVQNVALASFDHLPSSHHSEISTSSGKAAVEIFKLPGHLKSLLLKKIYTVGQEFQISSWDGFLNSTEKTNLEAAIENLTAPPPAEAAEGDDSSLCNLKKPVHTNTTHEEPQEYTSISTDAGSLIDSDYYTGEGLSAHNTPQ